MNLRTPVRVCAGLLATIWAAPLTAQEYENPPQVLSDRVAVGALAIVQTIGSGTEEALDQLTAAWPDLVFYTIADAVSTASGDAGIDAVSPYRYAGESARTDKQLGSTPGSRGTTTLNEKPGIPMFLSMALEHGAIQRETSGTNLTLSTSPYSLIKLWEPDSEGNFLKYGFWRRFAVSVSFALDDEQATPTGSIDPKQISEWSVRTRLIGDRSPRSTRFTRQWKTRVQPLIQRRLVAITEGLARTLNNNPDVRDASASVRSELRTEIGDYIRASAGTPAPRQVDTISAMILSALKRGIFDRVRAGQLRIPDDVIEAIETEVIPTLQATHQALSQVPTLLEEIVEDVNRAPLLSLAYTNHTANAGSGYSDLKLLFEGFVAPLTIVGNVELALYHDPDPTLNQSSVRGLSGGFTLEGSFANFLRGPSQPTDFSKITLSASGRFTYLDEIEDDLFFMQVKLDIPVFSGVNTPLSVTYSSRTELIDEDEVRGNFGISFDLDKLFAASRAALPR